MVARFMGFFPHTLDEKGRVIIPRKFRDEIRDREAGSSLICTKAPDRCLFIYTEMQWAELCERQEQLNKGSRELWRFQRWFHATAEPLTPDRQGRILIPERLRKLVGIERDLVLAGCYDRIEVWEKSAWEAAQEEAWQLYADNPDAFLAGGPSNTAPNGEESGS